MPQFGPPDSTPDFPSWATEPIRSKISRHPTSGTPRADGRLVLPSDPLGRHMATRHACRIHYDAFPNPPADCSLCEPSADSFLSLVLRGSPIPDPLPPIAGDYTTRLPFAFPQGLRVGPGLACQWANQITFPWPPFFEEYADYELFLVSVGGSLYRWELQTTVRLQILPGHITPTCRWKSADFLGNSQDVDCNANLPADFAVMAGTNEPSLSWDWALLDSVRVARFADLPQTPEGVVNYERSESVSIELQAKSVFEAHGWSGTTASGHNVYWRIKWRPSLPIAAKPGVEHEIVFFDGGIEVGRRMSEWPDDVLPWSLESGLGLAAAAGETRTPPDDEPLESGQFFGFESQPLSDRWEWWNSHQLCPNFYEISPNGSVAVEARIRGFHFRIPQTTEGSGGWQRRWFEDLINRRHILQPVIGNDGRWLLNTLVKHGEVIYDPDAGTPVSQDGIYYTYAIVLVFAPEGLALSLHIRLFNDLLDVPPFWEPVPSITATLFGIGINHGGKVLGATPNDDLRLGAGVLYPIQTRSMDQYELRDIVLTDKSPGPHPWLLDFEDCRISLGELKQRGDEPPTQGPLESQMNRRFSGAYARPLDVGQSISPGPVDVVFDDPQYDVGGWLTGTPSQVVVPDIGLRWARFGCQVWTSNNVNAASMILLVNGTAQPVSCSQQENNGGSIGNFRQNAWTPWIAATPGDIVTVQATKQGAVIDNVSHTWVAAEGRFPEVFPLSARIAEYGEPLPAVGEISYAGDIPPSADGFALTSASASLLSAKSTLDPITCQVSVIRKATRAIEDLIINTLAVDADHWSSDTSASPAVINPATATVFAGDIVIITMIGPGVGATGLSVSLEFTEP